MYPNYVQDFRNNRFKFVTVNKILHDYDTVLYADSSVYMLRNIKQGVLTDLFDSMKTTFSDIGIRILTSSSHTNYPVTHPNLYSFFKVTVQEMKDTTQLQAGVFLINNSPAGLNVMRRMISCSLEPNCMAPEGAQVKCPYPGFTKNDAIVCHRFDQSALNMLMLELYGTDQTKYYNKTTMLHIKRFEECTI
uniref:SEA domain-containing protein n=1 Tax=Panagrellus redivivus TaxID=6233 RepID=A0A7E4W082_PANRE